jgi:transcriptional regulator with XRE-family HTH domain
LNVSRAASRAAEACEESHSPVETPPPASAAHASADRQTRTRTRPKAILKVDEEALRLAATRGAQRHDQPSNTGRSRVGHADVTIGTRIKAVRLARGITQTELATRLGVTFQQVQKYEIGLNRVSAVALARVATILRVSPDALLKDIDGPVRDFVPLGEHGGRNFAHEALLLDLFRSMGDVEWRIRILELVEMIAAAKRRVSTDP